MATSSFFYGGTTAPDQNTVDKLIDDLNQKVQAASESESAAEAAAVVAQTAASNAVEAEASVANLSLVAQETLEQAQAAVVAAEETIVEANAAADSAIDSANLAEDWATKLGTTVDGVEYSSKYYAQASSTSASAASGSASAAAGSALAASGSATAANNSANLAEDWATKTTGTVDGSEYSAKYYASLTATTLASKANSDGSNATGTWDISISGNAATVTNGVYTSGSYSDPSWITDISYTKITGLGTIATQDSDNVNLTGGDVAVDNLSSSTTFQVPVVTTATRPSTTGGGWLIFNDDTNEFEGYNGTAWASVGGSAISNDTSTSTDVYPLFANATSGTAANVYTSNAKYLYKPSTGELKAQELVATNGIVVNSATVSANYTIPTGSNAMSAGPVSVASGVAVTVSSGSVWTIV